MKSIHLRLVDHVVMRSVAPKGRKTNNAYRAREHLTEDDIGKLLAALKANRYGHRDCLIGLPIYRHGLRVSEACDPRGMIST
jgi:integrase